MRAFVGLPVPEPWIAPLVRAQGAVPGGRRPDADDLHVTLAFLDDQPATRLEALHEALEARPLPGAALAPLRTGMDWGGVRVLAFAGIGRPAKFFATLADLGADVVRAVPLGDHQPLTPALMTRLSAEARARDLTLATTEKDAARLPAAFRREVTALPVRLRIEEGEAALDGALERIAEAARARRAPSP